MGLPMPASDAGSLYDLAQELLDACEAAIATTTNPPSNLRSFVSVGLPPYDCCPMLAVNVGGGAKAPYGASSSAGDSMHRLKGPSVNLFTFTVTMLRCVTTIQASAFPSPATLSAEAEEIYEDGWVLWNYLSGVLKDGTLWQGLPCRDTELGPLTPVQPQGLCAGWTLILSTVLGGFDATP